MARRRAGQKEELSLIPVMNLVTILIPFLLMAAQFVEFAAIDTVLPHIDDHAQSPPEEGLNLRVLISDAGLTVQGNSEVLSDEPEGMQIACRTPGCTYSARQLGGEGPIEAYDVAALRKVLNTVKDQHPKERAVILLPDEQVSMDVLVAILDATREDPEMAGDGSCTGRCLFPSAVFAGGVPSSG